MDGDRRYKTELYGEWFYRMHPHVPRPSVEPSEPTESELGVGGMSATDIGRLHSFPNVCPSSEKSLVGILTLLTAGVVLWGCFNWWAIRWMCHRRCTT